ncbi:hypothetical protein KAR91_72155 [Candidatus Pacearchaeota archaeon]|nr:hypothetical protein [Candidatus Pacearchaeota archaeon]
MGEEVKVPVKDIIDGIKNKKAFLGQGAFRLPFGPVDSSHIDSIDPPYCKLEIFGPNRKSIEAGDISNLFCKGWKFRVTDTLPTADLFSMAKGLIRYERLTVGDTSINSLVFFSGDFLSTFLIKHINGLPDWFPLPKYIVYENVDEAEVRNKILQYISSNPDIKNGIIKQIRTVIEDNSYEGSDAELVNGFVSKQLPSVNKTLNESLWIKVNVGTPLGKMGNSVDVNGERNCIIEFLEELSDIENPIYLNPSYYLNLINNTGSLARNILDHPLAPKLLDSTETITSNGNIRFVKKTGSDQAIDNISNYLTPATAAMTITSAINNSRVGDYILIMDSEIYMEDELVITKPITISGINRIIDESKELLSGYGDDETIDFLPIISGNNTHRVIRIENNSNGIVHIGHISVKEGSDKTIGGAGICVNGLLNGIRSHNRSRVHISNCLIMNNQSRGGNSPFVHGWAGGVLIYHCSPVVYGCIIKENFANRRGGGIGCYGYGWPSIIKNRIKGNQSKKIDDSNATFDGGGVAIVTAVPKYHEVSEAVSLSDENIDPSAHWDLSDVEEARRNYIHLIKNIIKENYSADDGGGLYISIMAKVLMEENILSHNYSANNGGGVRITFGSTVGILGGRINNNKCGWNMLASDADSTDGAPGAPDVWGDDDGKGRNQPDGGGGIACRNANLLLNKVTIEGNESPGFAGGGIYFLSTEAGYSKVKYLIFEKKIPWMPIANEIFRMRKVFLTIINCEITNNKATRLSYQTDEHNHGKGGGLYIFKIKQDDIPIIVDYGANNNDYYKGFQLEVKISPRSSIGNSNQGSFPDAKLFYLDDPDANVLYDDTFYQGSTEDFKYVNDSPD